MTTDTWADFTATHPVIPGCAVPSCTEPGAVTVELIRPCGGRTTDGPLCTRHQRCCETFDDHPQADLEHRLSLRLFAEPDLQPVWDHLRLEHGVSA